MAFDPKSHTTTIKGKDYLDVKWRIVWMRDEHPAWTIMTDVLLVGEMLIIKALIQNDEGVVIATGMATVRDATNQVWSGRPIEKAETAAIGRALAHAGYGTAFMDEDGEDNLADAPVAKKSRNGTTEGNKRQLVWDLMTKAEQKPFGGFQTYSAFAMKALQSGAIDENGDLKDIKTALLAAWNDKAVQEKISA